MSCLRGDEYILRGLEMERQRSVSRMILVLVTAAFLAGIILGVAGYWFFHVIC